MKKNLAGVLALAVVMVMGLAVAGVRPATGGNEDNITICHAAGLAGTIQYVTLTISPNAVFGPAGHFNEDGTPQAGHEQDYMGACTIDTTTTTTTTTDPDPRGVAAAGAICIRALGRYNVFGTIDGDPALVDPETIPGGRDGPTLVNVYESNPADGQLVIVNTDGECFQSDETTTTTTTTTTPSGDDPPGGPRCPPGEFPTDGKDGEPGNEECEPPPGDTPTTPAVTTPTTTTDSTTIAETTTEETTTTTEEPTTTPPPVKAKPKPKPKPNKPKKSTAKKKQTTKNQIPPLCPVGKPTTGVCAVQGSG